MNIVFFDLESTGVDLANDRIVDIAAIRYDNYMEANETQKGFETLLNPQRPITNSDIHNITDEMVIGAPIFSNIAEDLKELIGDCFLSGFNIKRFDVPLLAEEFNRAGIEIEIDPCKIIDPFILYKILFPQSLAAAHKKYTGEDIENAHRAMVDTIASQRVLRGMFNKNDVPTNIDELLRFQNNGENFDPTVDYAGKFIRKNDGTIVFNFGKYKGENVLRDNDTIGFLEWMLFKDFTSNTKMFARKFISEYNSHIDPF